MPVRLPSLVVALAAAASLVASRALADEPAPAPVEDEDATPAAPTTPEPPPPSPPVTWAPPVKASAPMTPDPTEAGDAEVPRHRSHHFIGRLGALGAYRQLYDLPIFGAGAALSLGSESDKVGGHVDFHFIDARSQHGLVVLDMGLKGTAEWLVGSGWRLGFGGGITYFGVQRATTGYFVQCIGPLALVRTGYDFGQGPGAAYFLVDFEGQLQNGPIVWGPTLHVGVRF